MLAMMIALVGTVGASLGAAGSGALQEALRFVGFGRDTVIQAEQRRQASEIAELDRIIQGLNVELAALSARAAAAEDSEAAANEQLAKINADFAALKADLVDIRSAQADAATQEAWRKPVDHLMAAVTRTRSDIIGLRWSIDTFDQTRRADLLAIVRRLDRLEQAIIQRDATSSLRGALQN